MFGESFWKKAGVEGESGFFTFCCTLSFSIQYKGLLRERQGGLWEPIRAQQVCGRRGSGLRSRAKPSCCRPAGRTQPRCWCSSGFPGARLQRKYVQTGWGWGRVVSQPKYWISEYLWWHKYLTEFVSICWYLTEFVSIWQYFSVFFSICQYLSELVSLCRYGNTSDDIDHSAGEVSIRRTTWILPAICVPNLMENFVLVGFPTF